jgi:hypothetical protein
MLSVIQWSLLLLALWAETCWGVSLGPWYAKRMAVTAERYWISNKKHRKLVTYILFTCLTLTCVAATVVPHEAMQAPQRTVKCWTVWRDCNHRCCWTKGIHLINLYASHNHWSTYRWTFLCAWCAGCFIYREKAPTTLSKAQNEPYNRHNKHYYSLGSLISVHKPPYKVLTFRI